MPEFHETRMGQRFIESTMPSIADSLKKIADKFEPPKVDPAVTTKVTELISFLEGIVYKEWNVEMIVDVLLANLRIMQKELL